MIIKSCIQLFTVIFNITYQGKKLKAKNLLITIGFSFAIFGISAAELTKAQANDCINQIKIRLKDPDSAKLVQIMGNRGMTEAAMGGATWIRYKSTNSYGGYVSSSMMCHPTERVAVVAESLELSCMSRVMSALVKKPGAFENSPPMPGETRDEYIKRGVSEISKQAASIVKEGIDDLPECN